MSGQPSPPNPLSHQNGRGGTGQEQVAATPLLPFSWEKGPGDEGLPLVKICGLREPEHALLALERGAAFLGLNFFAPSPRWLTVTEAQRVSRAVRRVDPERQAQLVGLFVNETPAHMNAVADEVGLDIIQLSGDEQPELVAQLNRPVIGAVHANDANTIEATARFQSWVDAETPPWAIIVDTKTPGLYGGTGTLGDWVLAAELAQLTRIFLAGGLTPKNVGPAIQAVRPYAVDVSSGVETDKRKDPAKIEAFLINVQAARASLLTGQRGFR